MERNVRGRYTSRRTSTRRTTASPSSDFKSRLLVQCMVCGVALAIVLLVCIINTQFCNEVRVAVKSAITKQTDLDDIKNFTDASKDKISDAEELLNSLFKFSSASDDTDPYLNNSLEDGVEVFNDTVSGLGQSVPQTVDSNDNGKNFEFRIDEDILNEMNTRTDTYLASKKASAPEPSFIPELR